MEREGYVNRGKKRVIGGERRLRRRMKVLFCIINVWKTLVLSSRVCV
jgi:hypothetical protein